MAGNFRELVVWQKAMNLTAEVYRLAKSLPAEERYALSDQMRRAAVSIPSNIAEGNSRGSNKDYAHFLSVARGSNSELVTQLLLCTMVGYLTENDISQALSVSEEVGRMLTSLIRRYSA